MLAYARTLVGRPFSNAGMVRSIIYPRQTDERSFFCAGARSWRCASILCPANSWPRAVRAELVAAVLRVGGLLTQSSNPGSATPESLHRVFKDKAAVTANPYILRQFNANSQIPLGYEAVHGSAASSAASAASTALTGGAARPPPVARGQPTSRAGDGGGLGGASRARQRAPRRGPSPPRAAILYRPL